MDGMSLTKCLYFDYHFQQAALIAVNNILICWCLTEYENYPAHDEYEEYNNYDPDNVKYETEGETHFQHEEY